MTKQIKIEKLIPLMRKGWVAMDIQGEWWWFETKPIYNIADGFWYINYKRNKRNFSVLSDSFNIAPAKSPAQSLIKTGGK